MGPTGVGKTELAKALAEFMFNLESALIRIDMSEYTESHSVARLIGAPPGYVGFEQGGQLTEAVRRKPYSVILFDEIEKAHPQIFNIFLQLMDDGRLTDGKGRTINFKNTIIIMTSNLGSDLIRQSTGKITQAVKQQVWEKVEKTFPPEFINRLDQIIIFDRLTPDMLKQIVDLQLDQVLARLKQQKINLKFSASARAFLAQQGYDPTFGARPLKRVIQNQILDPLALEIIDKKIKPGQTIKIDLNSSKSGLKLAKA
jgi:ATP-dependent Clp protease ATP-binding subunit ClpB